MNRRNNSVYVSALIKYKKFMKKKVGLYRLKVFLKVFVMHLMNKLEMGYILIKDLINCTRLFPRKADVNNVYDYALKTGNLELLKLLIDACDFNIHEISFSVKRHPNKTYSALHYLAEIAYDEIDGRTYPKVNIANVIQLFLTDLWETKIDSYGYTYLHAACMIGHEAAVSVLFSPDSEVPLDRYKYSPLSIAAQYRRVAVAKLLLSRGADPNQRDEDRSTPLHALSRLCLCLCTNGYRVCDKRKPADDVVQLLVSHGADIEAENDRGRTPLQCAVECFDAQLVQALLNAGARLKSLNEIDIFGRDFSPSESKNYPLALNIIEVMHLLNSAGYEISFTTRLRMIRCLMRVRGNDTDHIIPQLPRCQRDAYAHYLIAKYLCYQNVLGFYMTQEAKNVLQRELQYLKPKITRRVTIGGFALYDWINEVSVTKRIMLAEDLSLYQIWKMSYAEGCSKLKSKKIWSVPPMNELSHLMINVSVKRHMGNIFVRMQLELFVSDLFMTDYCRLNLPYAVCRQVVEYLSDEELLHFCNHTDENALFRWSRPLRRARRRIPRI